MTVRGFLDRSDWPRFTRLGSEQARAALLGWGGLGERAHGQSGRPASRATGASAPSSPRRGTGLRDDGKLTVHPRARD